MLVVIVRLHVKRGMRRRFLRAIRTQARTSLQSEPGCLRFDVSRVEGGHGRFILYEVYANEGAFYEVHRSTPHYVEWRNASSELIEEGGWTTTFCRSVFADICPDVGDSEVRTPS